MHLNLFPLARQRRWTKFVIYKIKHKFGLGHFFIHSKGCYVWGRCLDFWGCRKCGKLLLFSQSHLANFKASYKLAKSDFKSWKRMKKRLNVNFKPTGDISQLIRSRVRGIRSWWCCVVNFHLMRVCIGLKACSFCADMFRDNYSEGSEAPSTDFFLQINWLRTAHLARFHSLSCPPCHSSLLHRTMILVFTICMRNTK